MYPLTTLLPTLALLFISIRCVAGHTKGVLPLDKYTFEKLMGRHKAVVVKFDKQYAYGAHEEEFKKLAIYASTQPELLVTEVGTTDWGEKENQDLRERYGVDPEQYPVYKLFLQGGDISKPISYTGDIKVDQLVYWITDNTGLWIGTGSSLEEFDNLAQKFFSYPHERISMLKEAEDAYTNLKEKDEKEVAKLYMSIMKKLVSVGDSYIKKEMDRISKLLAGNLKPDKKDQFRSKVDILTVFELAQKANPAPTSDGQTKKTKQKKSPSSEAKKAEL